MDSYNYERTIKAIVYESEKINITYSSEGDGRITSAVKETEYLDKLNKGLRENHPSILFEYPPSHRWWWDCKIDGIPINLKLTTGGTDNVFNKVAIIYSISGKEPAVKSMNFNTFFQKIKACVRKNERNLITEYHYLVVNKNTGKILLKSIFDVINFKTNPCNILQINWCSEFLVREEDSGIVRFEEKYKNLLKIIQKSVIQDIKGKSEFAEANIGVEL